MKKVINFDKKIEFPSMIGEITSISLDHDLKFKDESNIVGKFILKGTYKRTEASRLEEDFSFDIPTEIILTEKLDLSTTSIDIDDFYYEIDNEDTITCFITILVEGMEIVELSASVDDLVDEPIRLDEHDNIHDEIKYEASVISDELTNTEEVQEVDAVRECDGDPIYKEQDDIFDAEQLDDNVEDGESVTQDSNEDEVVENNFSEKKDEEILVKEENEEEKMPLIKNNNDQEKIEINEDVGSLFTSLNDSEETFSTYSVYILREEETVETILAKFKITKEELESYNDISNIKIGSKIIIPVKNETN